MTCSTVTFMGKLRCPFLATWAALKRCIDPVQYLDCVLCAAYETDRQTWQCLIVPVVRDCFWPSDIRYVTFLHNSAICLPEYEHSFPCARMCMVWAHSMTHKSVSMVTAALVPGMTVFSQQASTPSHRLSQHDKFVPDKKDIRGRNVVQCNLLCYVKCSPSLLPFKAVAVSHHQISIKFCSCAFYLSFCSLRVI